VRRPHDTRLMGASESALGPVIKPELTARQRNGRNLAVIELRFGDHGWKRSSHRAIVDIPDFLGSSPRPTRDDERPVPRARRTGRVTSFRRAMALNV
jgi:hypothetical protein